MSSHERAPANDGRDAAGRQRPRSSQRCRDGNDDEQRSGAAADQLGHAWIGDQKIAAAPRGFEIIQILRLAGQPATAARIAQSLGVTSRSIYRDIVALQAMQVPVQGGRGIGYRLRPGFDLPPLMFSIEETEAIVLALALLERTGDVALKQSAKRVGQKIAAAVPPPLRQDLRHFRTDRVDSALPAEAFFKGDGDELRRRWVSGWTVRGS